MFSVSVVDHVRLNFGQVVQNYTVHARAAERLAALGLRIRFGVLALFAFAAGTTALGLSLGHGYQVGAAVMIGLALIAYTAYIATNVETRLHGHRSLAHRLWLMCERYRSLLAEIQDGLLDDAAILERRDALIEQVHAVYEQGFPPDQQAFEGTRQLPASSEAGGISEEQIDRFLPASIRKGARIQATSAPVPH